jgi:thymidylate synthase (FAD)
MKIVKQSATLEALSVPVELYKDKIETDAFEDYDDYNLKLDPGATERIIEKAARTCYKSEDKIDENSYLKMISIIKNKNHTSVLEHASATFRIICDRGISHELVRHRIAAFSQESTRYCNYGKEKFNNEITVIEPPFPTESYEQTYAAWKACVEIAEVTYLGMLSAGVAPQIARSVLPTCLKTELVMTCNFREWLHIINLRTSDAAHPQIRGIVGMIQAILKKISPCIFE